MLQYKIFLITLSLNYLLAQIPQQFHFFDSEKLYRYEHNSIKGQIAHNAIIDIKTLGDSLYYFGTGNGLSYGEIINNDSIPDIAYKKIIWINNMAMDLKEIEKLIKEAMPDAKIEIQDLAGDGNHYSATVTSSTFSGKSKIEQHKMVYNSLKGKMGNELHALAIKTKEQ